MEVKILIYALGTLIKIRMVKSQCMVSEWCYRTATNISGCGCEGRCRFDQQLLALNDIPRDVKNLSNCCEGMYQNWTVMKRWPFWLLHELDVYVTNV